MKDIKLIREKTKDITVLYVEDDLSILNSTSSLLEKFFTNLDTADNGESGIEQYIEYEKEYGKYYDLIITDIFMPRMNGIIMSEKILNINLEQSILIMTAHNEIEFISAAMAMGIDGFVTKPIVMEKLIQILYKVSHAISNNKFVESNIVIMKDLNTRLEIQNKELIAKDKELEKYKSMIDTMIHKK